MSHSVKSLLKIYGGMIQTDPVDVVGTFRLRIRRLNICSVVLLPALKAACSSACTFSTCGWSIFNMTLLGWLIRPMVL